MIEYDEYNKKILIHNGSGAGRPQEIEVKKLDTLISRSDTRGSEICITNIDLIFPDGYIFRAQLDDKITCETVLSNIDIFNNMYDKLYYTQDGDSKRLEFIKRKLSLSDLGWENRRSNENIM